MKRTFSCTQNEVVSFSTESDLDPSDPQSGPFEQPYLHVFKPVVADSADHLPGWCNLEKTPPVDPVDPRQDSSGHKQTAPEQLAASQPGSFNTERHPTVMEIWNNPLLLFFLPPRVFPAPWKYEQPFLYELDQYSKYTAIMFRLTFILSCF